MEIVGEIVGTDIKYTQVSIYSGILTDAGIQNFTMGFIQTSKENDIYDDLMEVNDARVFAEGDGLASALDGDPGFDSSIARKVVADGEAIKNAIMAAAKR